MKNQKIDLLRSRVEIEIERTNKQTAGKMSKELRAVAQGRMIAYKNVLIMIDELIQN